MKSSRRSHTRRWLTGAAAGLASFATADRLPAAPWVAPQDTTGPRHDALGRFGFSYDHVLGTSLDVHLAATSPRDASACEAAILAEIDRLEKILSTYDPASEISRVQSGASIASPELADVLAAYDLWSARTGGALSSNLSGVMSLWRDAACTGRMPEAAALAATFATPRAFNVDALGKGYIVDRAVAVARRIVPSGLLNLGGDIRAWGDAPWMVGVADPQSPADNAAPLVQFPLREAAVATSAGYTRALVVGDRRFSHLIDPRTLRPIDPRVSATIVAPDCVTANALSTATAVLGADAGANLARGYGLDHLIVDTDKSAGSLGSTPMAASAAASDRAPLAADEPIGGVIGGDIAGGDSAWPNNYQVNVKVTLRAPDGFRFKRPYVAVWIEGSNHQVVRTLTIWGNQGRYLPDLSKWWRATGGDRSIVNAVSRGTRSPGSYSLAWDGRDDRGHPVPAGDYRVWVEINREHGHHVSESAVVTCGREPVSVELHATAESDASPVSYGPKGS